MPIGKKLQEKNAEIEKILNNWGLRPENLSGGIREEKKGAIEKWFRCFSPSEFDDAFLILERIQYHDALMIDDYIKGLSKELKRVFGDNLSDVKFFPLGESPASSGGNFLYSYRKELGLSEYSFPYTPFKETDFSNTFAIVFFDDIIGSGNQAITFAKENLQDITLDKYYVTLMAFEEGYNKVKSSKLFKDVIVRTFLSDEYRAFSENSQVFQDKETRERIKKLCLKYGEKLYDHPLGYDDSQALIVLHHNAPNNTLPIIWASDANEKIIGFLWSPVWERKKIQRKKKDNPIFTPSILPEYSSKLRNFVTENRACELTQVLTYIQNHRIVLISGVGGVGKTTLARAIIDSRPTNVTFWFDFSKRRDASLEEVLEKLANYMNTPLIANFKIEGKKAGQDDIDILIAELQKRVTAWLVFDNLEMLLDDIYFRDPGLDLLFTSLRDSTYQAKIIITSRTLPVLADGGSLIDALEDEKQELKGLKTNFAVDYLVKNGLDEIGQSQLEKLASGVDGHPLALKLLIGLIKKFGVEDTLNDLSSFQIHKESTIKKARRLFDKLAGDEKELLERISVFRQPESKTVIEKMFTATTSKEAVEKLIDKSLLETDHKGNYWLHPLVREFAYDDLEDKIGVHKLIYKHYTSVPFNMENFVEVSHHLIKYREIIDDFVIDYFLNLPIDTYLFFIINETIKQKKIGNSYKIFDLINKFITSENDQIIISFILSYSYYFEDVYIIDEKASFEVYHKIIESYTDIKVFEAISMSVSSIANFHPSESLQIWKKLINIDEQLTEAVVFNISDVNLKSNEYINFSNDILCQNTNVSIYAKQMIINMFKNYDLIENYNAFSNKYYIDIKEHLKNIRNLSTDESINYIEKNYKIINPPFTLEILSDLIKYDKPRVYKLIFHVIEYHVKSYRMIIFQVSEILCQSLNQEELDYINLFLKNKKDKYALLVGMQTLDLLSKKFEKEILIKYLIPILEHEDITIKKMANITKKVMEQNSHVFIKQKKMSMLFRLLKTCMNPKNLITMLQTELFKTSPFVVAVWIWATKKTIENYNICEIYGVGKSTLKSSNPVILDASLCIMNKLQTDPKKYIGLVYKHAYKSKEKQVKFGSIPQFIFMGDREPEIIDRYLKEIMLDEDDDLVIFILENLKIYKNQNYSNRNKMLNYLINHKNPDISGFSDYLLNGI